LGFGPGANSALLKTCSVEGSHQAVFPSIGNLQGGLESAALAMANLASVETADLADELDELALADLRTDGFDVDDWHYL
jgi:hypothetical protein